MLLRPTICVRVFALTTSAPRLYSDPTVAKSPGHTVKSSFEIQANEDEIVKSVKAKPKIFVFIHFPLLMFMFDVSNHATKNLTRIILEILTTHYLWHVYATDNLAV